ncbi:MAG: hypothetical protein UZ07_CHB004001722 [Chlorobi bacterium OLB7]|nr:MAG: hypothetical protein UZ07_CHB004001722 [Chlorobi bacterium OLB7]
MNNHHRSAALAVGVLLAVSMATAQPPLEVEREFNIFTSQSAAGYFKPVLTTLQEGFASNIYHRASYAPQWSIGLDISSPWMVIPESHKTFSAQLPDCYADPTAAQTAELRSGTLTRGISGAVRQPTYYGSIATPAFSVPQGTGESDFCRTVGFAKGTTSASCPPAKHPTDCWRAHPYRASHPRRPNPRTGTLHPLPRLRNCTTIRPLDEHFRRRQNHGPGRKCLAPSV